MTLQKPGLRTITRVPYRIQKDHGRNMLLFNEIWTQVTQRKNPVKYGHQGDTPWCLYYCSAKKHHEPMLYCYYEKSRQRGRRVGSISKGGDNNSSKKPRKWNLCSRRQKASERKKGRKQCLCKILEGQQRVLWYFWKRPIKWLQYKGQTCTRRKTVLIHKNLSFFEQGTMSIKNVKRQTDPYGKAMKK